MLVLSTNIGYKITALYNDIYINTYINFTYKKESTNFISQKKLVDIYKFQFPRKKPCNESLHKILSDIMWLTQKF